MQVLPFIQMTASARRHICQSADINWVTYYSILFQMLAQLPEVLMKLLTYFYKNSAQIVESFIFNQAFELLLTEGCFKGM